MFEIEMSARFYAEQRKLQTSNIPTTSSKWFVCQSGRCFDSLSPADTNPVKADGDDDCDSGVYEMRPNSRGTFRVGGARKRSKRNGKGHSAHY